MSFRINSAMASMSAQRHLTKNQRSAEDSMMALASGSRINRAGDDAAGFAISENLRAQIAGTKQAQFNAENAVGLIQTAEGSLNEQNNILIRLRELAVYSASDTVGRDERRFLDKEFQELSSEFDRIAKSARYGNKQLLSGSGEEFEFQVGPNRGPENIIRFKLASDTTASKVGIRGLAVDDKGDALDALEDIDSALLKVADARSSFGAVQSRFQYAIDNLAVQNENLTEARSQIHVSKLAKANILLDAGVSVLTQANQDNARALRLIGR